MKRLSIIVPIYNVEPYIERCLLSLENQNIPTEDYEIICINDGSPDRSREFVIQMQKKFTNIILIDQANQGVSCARNNGINKACGKYVLFIDPDDYIEDNSISRILESAAEQKAQVSFLGFTVLNENGTVGQKVYYEEYINHTASGLEAYFITHIKGRPDPDRIYAVLLETEFINRHNLRFLPGIPYLEDGELISRILCLADRCIFDGHTFYYRTTRQGSATNSNLFHSQKSTNGFLLAAKNLKAFQQVPDLNRKQVSFLNQPICKFVVLVIASARKPFRLKRINEIRRQLGKSGLSTLNLESVDKEFTRLGGLYNITVYLLIVYQLFQDLVRSIHYRTRKFLFGPKIFI